MLRPSAKTGSWTEPRCIEPQVRVRGRADIVSKVMSRRQGLLWTRQRLSTVEAVAVQAVLQRFLPHVVELGGKGLGYKWRHVVRFSSLSRMEKTPCVVLCLCLTQVDGSGASQPDTSEMMISQPFKHSTEKVIFRKYKEHYQYTIFYCIWSSQKNWKNNKTEWVFLTKLFSKKNSISEQKINKGHNSKILKSHNFMPLENVSVIWMRTHRRYACDL